MTSNADENLLPDEKLQEIFAGCEGAQGGPWKLDKFGCYIWAPSEKGGDFPLMDEPGENGRVAELRGWGYYTGNGQGGLSLSPDEAARRQRLTGEHVARLDPQTVSALITELLARRRSDSAVERVDGWQPIETAPKDGTWVDLWRPPQPEDGPIWQSRITARWQTFDDGDEAWAWPDDIFDPHTDYGREHADGMISVGDCYEDSVNFTHWRPLPAPPDLRPNHDEVK